LLCVRICRVFPAVCFPMAHGKIFFKILIFVLLFFTTKILFCTLLQHVMHHVKIW
jgi:hypothetical protein